MEKEYLERSKMYKAFCDEKRIWIVHLLMDGEKCACALMEDTGMAQSALAYHMKILCNSSIVNARQEGKWTFYSLNEQKIVDSAHYLLALVSQEKK